MEAPHIVTDKVFRFGPCEVHLARREVTVDGLQRAIEPRAFNLLAYLLEQRHRVVSKDELLDKIWPHQFVTVGSIARAVLKARQALGDDGESVFIKTVPRVGYRFAVPLTADVAAEPDGDDLVLRGTPPTSVALLPFENLTGDRDLDWVQLGLMTLVNSALASATQLAPVSTPSLLTALSSLPAKAGREAKSAAVRRLTGALHVVEVSISRTTMGYRLDFRVPTLPTAPARTLYDGEPTALGQRLARELPAILLPGTQAAASVGFALADPLANQAFARAQQAAAEQKWQAAVNLLKVVLDLAPDSDAVRLEYLRALAPLGDAEAEPVATQLLVRAEAGNDTLLAASVHQAVGKAHFNRGGVIGRARFHLEQALLLAAGRETPDWTTQTLLLVVAVAVSERNFATAEDYLERVERLCEQSGNRIFPLIRTNLLSVIAASSGDMPRALQLSREGMHRSRAQRVHRNFMEASANAACYCLALGMLKEAAASGEEGFATALALGDRRAAFGVARELCHVYRDARAPNASARVLAAVSPWAVGLSPVQQECWQSVRGIHAITAGDHAAAADHLRESIALVRSDNCTLDEHDLLPWFIRSLIRSGRLDEVAQELKRVAQPPYAEDGNLQAALLHCRALLAHAEGDGPAALARLQEVVRTARPGFWHASACLDAAWLLAEAGRAVEAQALLGRLDEWFCEHPMAFATDARVKYGAGDLAGARDAHRRHAEAVGSALPDYYRQLGETYSHHAAAADAMSGPALAPIPCLPSAL